jgi:hypothetical protein
MFPRPPAKAWIDDPVGDNDDIVYYRPDISGG